MRADALVLGPVKDIRILTVTDLDMEPSMIQDTETKAGPCGFSCKIRERRSSLWPSLVGLEGLPSNTSRPLNVFIVSDEE